MFFKTPPFGLNISDYSIEIISLSGSLERPKLSALSREVLGPGIVEDGRILQRDKLENVLKNLIEKPKFGKIRTRKFIFSLPESKIFLHFFELSEILEKEKVEKEIEFQAIHNFPFPLSELYFDFTMRERGVLLVAIQRDIVDEYLALFKKLKILPIVLETESLSLARALIGDSRETILIADVGARTTNFSLFTENRLRLSISINIAGDKFSQALMAKLNVPFSEAEKLKKEIGLDPEKKEGKVFLVLQKEIQGIISEIRKIEDYLQKKEGKKIEKIIFAGGSTALPHLVEYLKENLEKEVFLGDPWEKINIDLLKKKEYFEKALEINPILYGPVIGSALRGLVREPEKAGINLLPKS